MNGYLKDMGHFFSHGPFFMHMVLIFFAHYCILWKALKKLAIIEVEIEKNQIYLYIVTLNQFF